MPCYHPVDAWSTGGGLVFAQPGDGKPVPPDLQVPCGRCIGCRLRRSAEWADRITHEQQLHDESCFITLTFDDHSCPAGLDHAIFQRWIRAVRRHLKRKVRYYMCGEYGPALGRPHFHVCFFGCAFRDRTYYCKSESGERVYTSAVLSGLWKHGFATVQDLNHASAAYCARYVVDKVTGDLADAYYAGRRPEYCRMSLRPGIGAKWFARFAGDLRHDYVIRDGRRAQVPRYYDKLVKRADPLIAAEVKERRIAKAREQWADNTLDRLQAKEIVQMARTRTLQRSLA